MMPVFPAASEGISFAFCIITELGKENINFLASKRGVQPAALLQQLGRACWTAHLPGELPFHPFPEQERRDMPASSLALPSADL